MTNQANNNNEHTVEVHIMDRTGHTTRVLVYDDVVEVVREEMGNGKWANVKTAAGNQTFTQFETLRESILANRASFSDAQTIQLITALTGGDNA